MNEYEALEALENLVENVHLAAHNVVDEVTARALTFVYGLRAKAGVGGGDEPETVDVNSGAHADDYEPKTTFKAESPLKTEPSFQEKVETLRNAANAAWGSHHGWNNYDPVEPDKRRNIFSGAASEGEFINGLYERYLAGDWPR